MSPTSTRSKIKVLAFFAVLILACFTLYNFVKSSTIPADEVRVSRRFQQGKHPLIHLRGNSAQSTASNFVFSSKQAIYECLDSSQWFHVVFVDKQHNRTQQFDLYLPNGQVQTTNEEAPLHLTESSRLYWEHLIHQAP